MNRNSKIFKVRASFMGARVYFYLDFVAPAGDLDSVLNQVNQNLLRACLINPYCVVLFDVARDLKTDSQEITVLLEKLN